MKVITPAKPHVPSYVHILSLLRKWQTTVVSFVESAPSVPQTVMEICQRVQLYLTCTDYLVFKCALEVSEPYCFHTLLPAPAQKQQSASALDTVIHWGKIKKLLL